MRFVLIIGICLLLGCANDSSNKKAENTEQVPTPTTVADAVPDKAVADLPLSDEDRQYMSIAEEGELYFQSIKMFEQKGAAGIERMFKQPVANANELYVLQREKMIAQRKKVGFRVPAVNIPAAWQQPQSISYDTETADLQYRYGDADNFGYGWPSGFDPFSGESTPKHKYPFYPEPDDPAGTDRIMVISGYQYSKETFSMKNKADGYTKSTMRPYNQPQKLMLQYDLKGKTIQHALLQLFVDDFQSPTYQSKFSIWLNGKEITAMTGILNDLKQGGPIGKLISFQILPDYFPLLQTGKLELLIDGPTTNAGDGFAIDFVQLLINPKNIPVSSIEGKVIDAKTKKPIEGALLKISGAGEAESGSDGSFSISNVPCGVVIVQGNKAGYKQGTVSTDVIKEKTSTVIVKLEPETNNTLQQQLEQKGKIELYGIYFDTDKATLKPESEKTLKQLFAFINANPGTALEIGGHTDAQGDDAYNLQLSQQRAEAVINWLKQNKAAVNHLTAKGYGETEPVADNSTETGRALNRRVEIKPKQ